ncbi:MAG: M20/M25/M40 family metallo-hydrolase, partial [Planctomycetota bacterium]
LGAERCGGKIVFFNRPMPRALMNTFQAYGSSVPQRTGGAVVAAKVGAKAVIVRSMTTSIDDVPHTGAMRYEKGTPEIPAAAISTKGAERIAKLIKAGKTVRMHLRMDCESHPDVESANVVGELVGSDRPDEIVVIGGHLDCWDVGQGAHDDGAGVTHCLEAVRLLQAASIPPKRTIRVVLFMNEENGLRGANAYVAAHFAELSRHVAAIESDRGGFEPKGFTSSLRGEALESLRRLVAPLRAYGMGALIPGGGGADVGRLGPHGVVLFGLIPSSHRYFDYHHSERDRIEMVNERELELGAAAVAYLASVLADHFEPERSSR